MTGLWVVLGVALFAAAFGAYRHFTDGRARTSSGVQLPSIDAALLGDDPGSRATLVQFSSAVCSPCRATHRILTEIADGDPTLGHIDLDAEKHLGIVRDLSITRTPTVLLLDAAGREQYRFVGVPRRAELEAALGAVGVPTFAAARQKTPA